MRRLVPLLATALVACSAKQETPPPPLVEVTHPASEQATDAALSFTGTVRAPFESDLGFRVAGTIVERRVDRGQAVRKGQVLARLDPADLDNQRRSAEATAAAARRDAAAAAAQASQAAAEERRLRGLDTAGAVAPLTYERARDQARAAAEQLASAVSRANAAAAQAAQARDQASYAELRAPDDGVVTEVLGEPGQVVQPGAPVIRFGRAGVHEAEVFVPETALAAVRRAAQASLYTGESASPAMLRDLAAAADPVTRTFRARFRLTGPAAQAPIGSTVTVTLTPTSSNQSSGAGRVTVPAGAIVSGGTGPHVFVVDRQRATVAVRPVRVVRMGSETALVEGELRSADLVVRQGGFLLKPGQKVRLAAGQER